MHRRTYLVTMVLILASFILGCGGGGSSSGGGDIGTNSLVGTWDTVSWSGGASAPPDRIAFNADGTGSYSGTISGSGTLTWSVSGSTLTATPVTPPGGSVMSGTLAWTDNNNVTITFTVGSNQIMNMRRR